MISIILPTYQPQDYLWQCLDSLVAQTLDKRLWEVVVVLNGPAEPWFTQLQTYQQAHGDMNMQLIHTKPNGVSHARNMGLEAAKGEYIGFVDDDDYVSPTYLEQLSHLATPDTIAASNTIAFDETRTHIPYYIEEAYLRYAPQGILPYYQARTYFGGPCMKLIHRDTIGEQRFDTRFASGEDSLFIFAISNRLHKIAFTDTQAVYYRRIRQGSASSTLEWYQRVRNSMRIAHQYTRIYASGTGYSLSFYTTRLLGALRSIIIPQ